MVAVDNCVLVTGAAGFIGSHTVLELLEAGFEVVAVDNFSNSIQDENGDAASLRRVEALTRKPITFVECDLLDYPKLATVFNKHKFSAVIHLASLKAVSESIEMPLWYYENNLVGVLNLLKACKAHGVKEFVFSSSSTVYGCPEELPLREQCATGQGITNPYGRTKYMIEQILTDIQKREKVGAHPSGLIGEDPRGIPNNLVAIGSLPVLNVFGTDYKTDDGTCVRDFIHVVDLAKAHVAALAHLKAQQKGVVKAYNFGVGKPFSVRQMVVAFEKVCGFKINTTDAPRRPGDVPSSYCSSALASTELNWRAMYGIFEMCRDTWNFIQKNPNGYQN